MAISIGAASRQRGALLLADISGYTGFLQGVTDAHADLTVEVDEPPTAYSMLSSLLDVMATTLAPAFQLVKFEGDAIFAIAPDGPEAVHGAGVVACLRACHAAFVQRLAAGRSEWTCSCNACGLVNGLGLKFVLHHGDYVTQRIVGREELAGPDVIVAHRLLKNHAHEVVGSRPYALLTDAALTSLEVPAQGMQALTETYEGLPPIPVHLLVLD